MAEAFERRTLTRIQESTATAPPPSPGLERFREYATSTGTLLRVDRDKGIIHGVKILGLQSLNEGGDRSYTAAAASKAIPLYEGAKVNVDHVKDGSSVSYSSRMGRLKNVAPGADGGLYADFHFNPKHALAEQLCWDAEHSPENVGFSHDVLGRKTRRDGQVIVEEISKVMSVDLVANPATTHGLFEDEETFLNSDPALKRLSEGSFSAMADARSILLREGVSVSDKQRDLSRLIDTWQVDLVAIREGEIADAVTTGRAMEQLQDINRAARELVCNAMCDGNLATPQAKRTRILQILVDWMEELRKPASANTQESIDMEAKDIKSLTVEQLREHAPELVAKLTGTDETSKLQKELTTLRESLAAKTTEATKLQEQLVAIEAEKAAMAKNAAISEELKVAGVALDAKNPAHAGLIEAIQTAADAPARKRIIESIQSLAKSAARSPVTTGSPFTVVNDGARPARDSLSGIFGEK